MPELIDLFEIFVYISILVFLFLWGLFCVKSGFSRMGKIISVFLLFYLVRFAVLSLPSSQQEPSSAEDSGQTREENILYEIDDAEKVTLVSFNGEICVKIPQWKNFSVEWTDSAEHGPCRMTSKQDMQYDNMTYELLTSWNQEDADAKIAEEFQRYSRDNIMGDVCHMSVDGINICYQACYSSVNSQWVDRYYMVWADLGCGQFLKTNISHYNYPEEPLNIEGIIKALYSNIEVCTQEGDSIPIICREPLPPREGEPFDRFDFGAVREYQTDEYREITVCAELIEHLYSSLQAGDIEEVLQREAIAGKKLSLAEKLAYIKKEETGTLIRYDTRYSHINVSAFPPTQCRLVEGGDASREFLIYSLPCYLDDLYDFVWFPCEKDGTGNVRAQKGIFVPGTDTEEHYFLSFQGNPYLCTVNRNLDETVESVILHDFMTPELIGTLIYIDASSVQLCSYVRSDAAFLPWYLYRKGSAIDVGDEFSSMLGNWEITEFLGESEVFHSEDTDPAVCAQEQKRTRDLTEAHMGQKFHINWGSVSSFRSASAYGYHYASPENLYKVYGQPKALSMEAPITAASAKIDAFDAETDILVDRNGRAAICIDGRFFLLKKTWEYQEELRTWE